MVVALFVNRGYLCDNLFAQETKKFIRHTLSQSILFWNSFTVLELGWKETSDFHSLFVEFQVVTLVVESLKLVGVFKSSFVCCPHQKEALFLLKTSLSDNRILIVNTMIVFNHKLPWPSRSFHEEDADLMNISRIWKRLTNEVAIHQATHFKEALSDHHLLPNHFINFAILLKRLLPPSIFW